MIRRGRHVYHPTTSLSVALYMAIGMVSSGAVLLHLAGLGAVLTAVYAGSHAVRDIIHRHNIGFSPLCGT